MSKSDIKLGLKNEPETIKPITSGKSIKKNAEEKKSLEDKRTNPAYIINRLNHPITLSYMGHALIIPPKGKVMINNSELLGGMASGVVLVKADHLKIK